MREAILDICRFVIGAWLAIAIVLTMVLVLGAPVWLLLSWLL